MPKIIVKEKTAKIIKVGVQGPEGAQGPEGVGLPQTANDGDMVCFDAATQTWKPTDVIDGGTF